jgi:PAS domain S-box-containing protein
MAKRRQALRKARPVKRPAKPAVDLKQENAALKRDLRERAVALGRREVALGRSEEKLREALEQQAAVGDVLKVISRSTFDLQAVLETLVRTAARLCSAEMGFIMLRDSNVFRAGAAVGFAPDFMEFLASHPLHVDRGSMTGRVAIERGTVHILDVADDPEYRLRESVTLAGQRTALGVPLLREDDVVGVIVLARQRVEPFTERQIELVRTFADQAVIAIENTRLLTEQRDALEQQTATAEVLQVINASPGDLAPVFTAMLEKATRLCGAGFGVLWLYDGERFSVAATHALPAALAEFVREPMPAAASASMADIVRGQSLVHVPDLAATELYHAGNHARRAYVDLGGARTLISVALRKDNALLGAINVYRQEVRPFSDKEIALLQNFAAQAVIAMENARLITETREALDQQTATAEVLRVISGSATDVQPVFEAIIARAGKLCEAEFSAVARFDNDGLLRLVAVSNLSADEAKAFHSLFPRPPTRGFVMGRAFVEGHTVHVEDVLLDPDYDPRTQKILLSLTGYRTFLGVPILRDGKPIGVIGCGRRAVRPFTPAQIDLVTTFADQAVIAIENARLFDELRERQAELARSVDELTATGDVLKIISRSSVDLETVLDTLVETVARLCRADQSYMFRRKDDKYHLATARGLSEEAKEFIVTHPFASDRGSLSGRVELERRAVHIPDVLQDPEYTYQGQKIAGYRTLLGVPLLREDVLIGVFILNRTRVDPYTNNEIELATSFADQAVIAIENARLFDELRERQAELRVTFDNMGDGVAMFDPLAHLVAWNRNLQEMLELPDAVLAKRPSYADLFRYLADRGEFGSADLEAELSRSLEDTSQEMRYERTRPDGRIIEVRRNPVPGGGFVLIYADITERKRAEEAIRAARDAAETALRELQAAQASLLHAQKMAALGQLTAGIAHEIKNPLNFVNNFAGLSVELLDELKEEVVQSISALGATKRTEIVETIAMLTGNLEKIADHGRRADGIVRSMLQHSRGGSGERQPTNLNALVEEALNLAYHGARAQDQSFNITMERDFDRNLGPIEVVPQDVTRVFLNLIGNGFYAASKRGRDGDGMFRPVLKVTTREVGETVEIRVRDNGVGIPAEYREKLFQPFFTTKPTGEGTGLGLSISYEIVTQQHGGTITVDSEVGHFTEFTVRLPRRRH